MLDENKEQNDQQDQARAQAAPTTRTRRRAVSRPAGPPQEVEPAADQPLAAPEPSAPDDSASVPQEASKPVKRARKTTKAAVTASAPSDETPVDDTPSAPKKRAAKKTAEKKAPAKKTSSRAAGSRATATSPDLFSGTGTPETSAETVDDIEDVAAESTPEVETVRPAADPFAVPLFKAPEPVRAAARKAKAAAEAVVRDDRKDSGDDSTSDVDADASDERDDGSDDTDDSPRRRRRRGGRRRRKSGPGEDDDIETDDGSDDSSDSVPKPRASTQQNKPEAPDDSDDDESGNATRRRRRRRRRGEDSDGSSPDDPANTVVRVREPRSAEDEITSVQGSTRLEAKKQRRREGREAGRRRAPIVTESEFLARRESVKREMVIRQSTDLTQIAVVEDDVLVEHYVARESQTSLIGNVYIGRVQNVLPSMEAAFVDIGKGRNAVLYAGEVDWKALGNGKQRKIEDVLKSGQMILVQVTKDPVGHKGARLTSQISLAGRFLVYVPGGQTSGISRKLPDTERTRLKNLLKEVLPEDAGVIIRTAAEGATEDQLTRDVTALTARWEDIEAKVAKQSSPQLLYGEPDLMIKVVRDLFNEDFAKLVVEGSDAWDMVEGYVNHVAPDLRDRLERWEGDSPKDVFAAYRIDEQIAKGLDRKVWLPSGGSLIIDRTEAMTVVDVNTGKFTGSGGNLEETVTKNNLEAAEEMVRQLRLRDIGGIIVIDFIDMVLENNRDLVLRRLVECLGRDRTRHQVAEVTSLGLVQMTRKRIGTGLLEAFSENCDHCQGRGLITHTEPIEPRKSDDSPGRGGRRRGGRGSDSGGKGGNDSGNDKSEKTEKTDNKSGDGTRSDKEVAKGSVNGDGGSGGSGRGSGGKGSRNKGRGSDTGGGDSAPDAPTEPAVVSSEPAAPAPAPVPETASAPTEPESADPAASTTPPRARGRRGSAKRAQGPADDGSKEGKIRTSGPAEDQAPSAAAPVDAVEAATVLTDEGQAP